MIDELVRQLRIDEGQTVVSALIKLAKKLPRELYKSLTWDRGKELTDHRRFRWAFRTCLTWYRPRPRR